MATSQRQRPRRGPSRAREPRYVEAVLDPTWQNPYVPSPVERESHLNAVHHLVLRWKRPAMFVYAVFIIVMVVLAVVTPWFIAVAVLLGALGALDLRRSTMRADRAGATLASTLLGHFSAGGNSADRQRLITVVERLSATFGIDGVSAFIVNDPVYNAALVPSGSGYSLFVTDALVRDFDLIECEGVVAHCMARERLGVLGRQCASATMTLSNERRQELSGVGVLYRADEVASAAIRYPLGIAGALRRCERRSSVSSPYFSSTAYQAERFVWFDAHADRGASDTSDLDDVALRAMALEEW